MRNEDCLYESVCTKESCINCIRYAEMKFLLEHSGIPVKKQKPIELIAGSDYNEFMRLAEIKSDIDKFVSRGNQLYICSKETGNGKTSWAIKLLLKYFDTVWAGNGFCVRGYFQHVPTLFNTLKDFSKSHDVLKNTLENADLIVWDDIASTKASDYDITQLLTILDGRITDGKSNIYTGNVTTKGELENAIGNRLASRVWNRSEIIEFRGKDRR